MENMNLAKRIADVKLMPGVGYVKDVHKSQKTLKEKPQTRDPIENIRAFRQSEEQRIKNENYLLAKRIAELKSIDSRTSVMKEVEIFQTARDKFKEQNELKKPKFGNIWIMQLLQGKTYPQISSRGCTSLTDLSLWTI